MDTPQAQNLPRIITREETIKMMRELAKNNKPLKPVSYTHLRAHETKANLVCRLLLEKKKK